MDEAEKTQLRKEILADVGVLLHEQLAASEWGRVLIEVVHRGEEPVVASVDVEEITGDESRVDAVFADDAVKPVLPVLAKATEALCGLEGLELGAVGGGTFLRQREGAFAWLPGLVHMPSPSLDAEWDELCQELDHRNDDLRDRFGIGAHDRYDVDIANESITFSVDGAPRSHARATLIATVADASRAWAWGGYNKKIPPSAAKASAALVDTILERDIWEISTPVFPVDAATAWVLAALVCERVGGQGVFRARMTEGQAFLLLRDVHDAVSLA